MSNIPLTTDIGLVRCLAKVIYEFADKPTMR